MIQNIIGSILKFLVSFLLLILAAHFILTNIPGDSTTHLFSASENKSASASDYESMRQDILKKGLNLPDFYFSIHSAALPPVYFDTYKPEEKRNIKQMAYHFGNAETVENFLRQLQNSQTSFSDDSSRIIYNQLLTDYFSTQGNSEKPIQRLAAAYPANKLLAELSKKETEMHQLKTTWKKFLPVVSFHSDNRFHQLLFGTENSEGLLHGSLGTSWQTRMPVSEMILSGFKWTILLSIISLLISLALSIFIGIKAGASDGSVFDRISSHSLFILYSIPVFWLAIILLMLFSNPHALNWLPASGIQPVGGFQEEKNILSRIISTIPYLILPLICFILPSLAFMARTIRAATAEIMQQDFIRTARAKGLPEKTILQKHVFRNVLLPVITLFALAWPALLSGSVIIENIFSIPGMGLLTFHAVQQQDYPVLSGVFITCGVFTLATFSLADILYSLTDTRLKT